MTGKDASGLNIQTYEKMDHGRRLAIVVEYEGTKYQGFQLQSRPPSIQGELELALEKVTGEKLRVAGAGRTDSGVHARAQVVSFIASSNLPAKALPPALNFYLPDDIAVQYAVEVPDGFNARRDALSRLYRYSILNSVTPSPLLRRFTHRIRKVLDVDAMDEAAKTLIGTHDYASFSRPPTARGLSTVRRVVEATVARHDRLVVLDIEANAFLTHQVRRTMGELVEVGLGRKSPADFKDLLDHPRPGAAAPTLSSAGLCLESIRYESVNLTPAAGAPGFLETVPVA